jgi:hypothetical protein
VESVFDGKRGLWAWRRRPAESEDERATRLLREALASGPVLSRVLLARAAEAGITRHFLRRAARGLGVEPQHRKDQPYYWCLPGQELPPAEEALPASSAAKDYQADKDGREEVKAPPHPVCIEQSPQHPVPVVIVGHAPPPGPAAKPNGRGRPSETGMTAQVYAFCHERYIAGDKLSVIRQKATKKFGAKAAPKEDSHVTMYARRHAEAKSLPPPVRGERKPRAG